MFKNFFVFVVLLAFLGSLFGQEKEGQFVQTLAHGKINWTENFVYVTGSAAPDLQAKNVAAARLGTERAAKLDAMRNMLELIKGVTVTGSTTIQNGMETSLDVKSQVDGTIQGMEIVDTKYYADGGVDIIMKAPLTGISDKVRNSQATEDSLKNKEFQTINCKGTKKIFVIDVRGMEFTPALFPVFYSENSKVIYSKKSVKENIFSKGMVRYAKGDIKAVSSVFGDISSSYTIKPLRIENKSDIIVSLKEIAAIEANIAADTFTEARVVILF